MEEVLNDREVLLLIRARAQEERLRLKRMKSRLKKQRRSVSMIEAVIDLKSGKPVEDVVRRYSLSAEEVTNIRDAVAQFRTRHQLVQMLGMVVGRPIVISRAEVEEFVAYAKAEAKAPSLEEFEAIAALPKPAGWVGTDQDDEGLF